jgi:hypothetical protein
MDDFLYLLIESVSIDTVLGQHIRKEELYVSKLDI